MLHLEEFELEVPWGHVSVKAWNSSEKQPVLVFHGLLDNAGSFDRLMPHLCTNFHYLCVDLPGHGRSSHFTGCLPIHSIDYIMVYKILIAHFKKRFNIDRKFPIIGHSYGAQISLVFAQLYPEYVEKIIMLDAVYFFTPPPEYFAVYVSERIDYALKLSHHSNVDTRTQPPTYTYDEALTRVINGRSRGNVLTREAGKAILDRNIKEVGMNRYEFTIDQRLKKFMNPLSDFENIICNLKEVPVKCPVLFLLGRESVLQLAYMASLIEFYVKECPNFRVEYVDGDHDVHNNEPERVSGFINAFFANNSKL